MTRIDVLVMKYSEQIGVILGVHYECLNSMQHAIYSLVDPVLRKQAIYAWEKLQGALNNGGCLLFATQARVEHNRCQIMFGKSGLPAVGIGFLDT